MGPCLARSIGTPPATAPACLAAVLESVNFCANANSSARNGVPGRRLYVDSKRMHIPVEPSILYFGTPVVLLSTLNEDGSANLAPMSSVWWLGWNCMLGLGAKSHTAQNLLREREAVLNLPSASMAEQVNRLAKLTGSDPVPPHKVAMGYRHEKQKFSVAGLSAVPSQQVRFPRVHECPVQMEVVLEASHPFGNRPDKPTTAIAFEMRVIKMYADRRLLVPGTKNHIDPDKWRPLLMSFCQFYGLGERSAYSTLAEIPEEAYRPVANMAR
jgi:flavin reductase (DIM6/NTAB) family NADH-FMN oxidoreductase RutF